MELRVGPSVTGLGPSFSGLKLGLRSGVGPSGGVRPFLLGVGVGRHLLWAVFGPRGWPFLFGFGVGPCCYVWVWGLLFSLVGVGPSVLGLWLAQLSVVTINNYKLNPH